ncbi:MAG: HAD family hydrolase [Bryobacteraceae bacterium]
MPRVRVISFDLWDTVFVDDSDEPKRRAQGLASKPVARRELAHCYLSRHAPIERALVDCAYDTADAAFREVWHNQHFTWTVAVRLGVLLKGLKRELPAPEFAELVRLHEDMELVVRPDLVPGVADAVRTLAAKYKLVVISDAIFSPGRALRELLAGYGLLDAFSAFVFSDEAGCSKPDPAAFEKAAELAGCRVDEIVHAGDREHNDIAGPKRVGARSVLVTAAIDRGSANTAADAVCRDYRELPAIIESLDTN